jgi:hypothetical protein
MYKSMVISARCSLLAMGWVWLHLGSQAALSEEPSRISSPPPENNAKEKVDLEHALAPFFIPPPVWTNQFGAYKSPLIFYDGRPVQRILDWPARRQEILAYWHKIMGPWPALLAEPRVDVLDQKRRASFIQHRVRLEIARQQFEEAFLLVPDGQGPFPAVLVPYYEPKTSIGLGEGLRDFGLQLAQRGFVTLSIGSPGGLARAPVLGQAQCQPLSFLAYVAANCWNVLAHRPEVDTNRIGVVGHSYGGKWAMFAACLDDRFACAAWSDPGIVFDERRPNVNYWDPWYLGYERDRPRDLGTPSATNPRTGAYRILFESGHDLHELHALMAPRPFLVSGGSEDGLERWQALNHARSVNTFLRYTNRVALTHRADHSPTPESNEQIYRFLTHFLRPVSPSQIR